ncbi:MAG: pyruvate kinase, partial [Candidatus Angelobacter sp.]
VRAVKRFVQQRQSDAWIIAKLEKPQAIEEANLEEILDVADGVMVARGDLGVEVAAEKVPVIQKRVIRRAAEWRKPVITATQMLESMIENPRPTRAEASDVANAIFDGTDAVMLSAETASGRYPREAVAIMDRIIAEAESSIEVVPRRRQHRQLSISETICESVAHAAHDLEMKAIAVYTETGATARLISKYRPQAPIYAFAAGSHVCARLNLLWGVQPVTCQMAINIDGMVSSAERLLLRDSAVQPGDVLAIVAGTRTAATGSTNFMRLHVVGAAEIPAARAALAGAIPERKAERRKLPRLKPVPERRRR